MQFLKMWVALVCFVLPISEVFGGFEENYEARKWEEVEVQLPPFPQTGNLVSFYVSATTDNVFFVDSSSISVGSDGVLRYVLVVVVPGGGRNVSFEGIRCETKERRLYAFGRPEGGWSRARNNHWQRVREVVNNRHHAALFQDHFCPGGVIVSGVEEARNNLRRGGQVAAGG